MFEILTDAERKNLQDKLLRAADQFGIEWEMLVPGRDYGHYPAWPAAGRDAWAASMAEAVLLAREVNGDWA